MLPKQRSLSGARAESGWLETTVGQVFCWFHPVAEVQRGPPILLCDPLGSDRMNLHLAYRYLAIDLSAQGYPVLRLDYPGTCDSEGSPRDPERVPALIQALHAGADFLASRTGSSQLVVFGARFGGTLAVHFASQRPTVSHLVLWGAYPSGRHFLRTEMAFDGMTAANPDEKRPSYWLAGDVEASGFLYRKETVRAVRSITINPLDSDRRALVFDWDDPNDSDSLVNLINQSEARVDYGGLVDRGTDSLKTQRVPAELVRTAIDWLDGVSDVRSAQALKARNLAGEVDLQIDREKTVRERCVRFGDNGGLFGILTTPTSELRAAPTQSAVLLVNGGNNHRVGINRNYTEWARSWAAQGFAVLRMDIRGLGDSPPLTEKALNRLYMERTVTDVQEAVDWLREIGGYNHITLCGYCAGAYQVLNLARRDPRFDALVLIELLRYYRWEPLTDGRYPIRDRLLKYWGRFHPMWLRDRGRIGLWLRDLARRHVHTLVIYRHDEQMLQRFEAEIAGHRDELEALSDFELAKLSSSNHITSPLFAQEELSGILIEFLQRHRSNEISDA